MESILFEIIVSRQCNKRCSYCDLDFFDAGLNKEKVDKITTFLNKNAAKVEYFHINFFGWEPLLRFDMIEYFLSKIQFNNIKYSVWTNWVLLDKNKLKIFQDNGFDIYLSIDTIDGIKLLNKKEFWGFEDFIFVNYIVDPDTVKNALQTLLEIHKKWFKKLNFMPVFSTKNRNKNSLKELMKAKNFAKKLGCNIDIFSYFNGISKEKQYIIDHDLSVTYDLDSLLWLQKQYTAISKDLQEEIEEESYVWKINEITFDKLLNNYSEEKLVELVLKIPKEIWKEKENLILSKLLTNGAKKG